MKAEIITYLIASTGLMLGLIFFILWLINHYRMRNEDRCLNFANWLHKNARQGRNGNWQYFKTSGEYSTYEMYNFWRDGK